MLFFKLKEAGTPTPFIISQIKNIQTDYSRTVIARACHEPVSIAVHIIYCTLVLYLMCGH